MDIKPKATELVQELAENNGGQITPEIVLDAARPKDSPLHPYFCWSNTKAAEQYRLIQAMGIIRRIKVTFTRPDESTVRIRAYARVNADQDEDDDESDSRRGVYVGIETVLEVESYHDQLIEACKRDIESFRRKYSALREVEKIIAEMNKFAD